MLSEVDNSVPPGSVSIEPATRAANGQLPTVITDAYTRRVVTCETRLYLRSPTRIAYLTRSVEFVFPPNYFAIRIREITHVEKEGVDLMLEALDFSEEGELDEYLASYQAEGWLHRSTRPRPEES